MRTTLELPDEHLLRAKRVALERRTTLKELIRKALEKELGVPSPIVRLAGSPIQLPSDSPLRREALPRDTQESQDEADEFHEVYRRR